MGATYFGGWVETYPDPNEPDRKGCAASFIGDTIEAALADAFKTGSYYLGLGYRVEVCMREYCKLCCGNGSVKGQRVRLKTCPDCKGVGEPRRFAPIPLVVYPEMKIDWRERVAS